MKSKLVRFKNKDYYVSYDDLLNKANNKLFAYEDEALTRNAKLNGKTLMFNKKDMEDTLKKDIKMSSPMPGAAKTENIQEKKMTNEEKLHKYIREMIREVLRESDPYGKPDEDKYLFKTGQDYLAGIQGDSGIDEEVEQPSTKEIEAKKKAAEAAQKKTAYQRFFSQALAKFGYSSPASIPDEKKKAFWDFIDSAWTSKQEAPVKTEMIHNNNLEEIDETSGTGGIAGYETPMAFTGKKGISKKQKSIANQLGYELVDKSYAVKDQGDTQDLNENINNSEITALIIQTLENLSVRGDNDFEPYGLQYEKFDSAAKEIIEKFKYNKLINEGLDSYYFKDDALTNESKLGLAIRQMKNSLQEVEKLMQKSIKLKTENNVDTSKLGKRAYASLKRINEKTIRLMIALNDLK
jgi:hypothetical protein